MFLIQSHNIFDFVKFDLIRLKLILEKLVAIFLILILFTSCESNSKSEYGADSMNASEDSAYQAYRKVHQESEKLEHDLIPESSVDLRANYQREILILDAIYQYDQGIRSEYLRTLSKYGENSKEVEKLIGFMRYIDSASCIEVTKIIDEHGWLGSNEVGSKGNSTLFLVIQHANLEIQEKYLPMMRRAVEDGKVQASSVAYLEDRILIRTGKKQLYGSQFGIDSITHNYFMLPIEDEVNVNKRRAAVGLGPLEDYAKICGIEYVLPKD